MIVTSKQNNVNFIYCSSPITIDKSKDWGGNNLQVAETAWLKLNSDNTVSHLVQDNGFESAPLGWFRNSNGSFDKSPIYVIIALETGIHPVKTKDGDMDYNVTESSYLVCNLLSNKPDYNDCWVMTKKDLLKHYNYEETRVC